MRARIVAIIALSGAVGAIPRPVMAQIDAEQVRQSIERGIAYLKKTQREGGWSEHPGQPEGITALCTLALLSAGVPAEDESVQAAMRKLRATKPTMTYTVALQTMVFCAAEPHNDRLLIRRNAKWLEDNQTRSGPNTGGWTYQDRPGSADNSNSQFAILALHEAERAGVAVSQRTWRMAYDYWKGSQNPDGSWGYPRVSPGSGSMTCAGIASMIITSGELNAGDAKVVDGQVQCCGAQQDNEAVERGLAWLERNFSVHNNPGTQNRFVLYYLYGVERAGRMTNHRFIGQHDWYREGADMLVRQQDNGLSGYWRGDGIAENNPHIGTSLALLFLAKGRRPILCSKVKHGPADDWNHHRGDLGNLTTYVESKWRRDLTWQIIDPQGAAVEDLLQSPVLYISGREAPQFSDHQKKDLRAYIDRGGFLFASASCEGKAFDQGFRRLMSEVFPEEEYKLRLLPPEHPIWRAEEPVNPKFIKPLWGIDIGCRTSIVYCPEDLSCYWELARGGRRQDLPAEIAQEVSACMAIGANVMAYATNREVKFKDPGIVSTEKAHDPIERGKLSVAKLRHPGGCNAAPMALVNLLRIAEEKLHIRVSLEPSDLLISDPQIFNHPIVFMHGRNAFSLTPEERKQLRTYLERGGVLFADAICSSEAFGDSFRDEMKAIFPEQPLERIPVAHALFSLKFGGENLSTVQRRQPESAGAEGPLKVQTRQVEPMLEGIKLGLRYAVIFSRYDVSCALESRESLECEGYSRQDAARIALNVLLYALHQ